MLQNPRIVLISIIYPYLPKCWLISIAFFLMAFWVASLLLSFGLYWKACSKNYLEVLKNCIF